MKLRLLIALIAAVICLAVSCKKEDTVPSCIQKAITNSLSKPVGTDFVEIVSYKYQGATVYLLYPGCCDQFNPLWDAKCNYLFSPSGGIGGNGDHTHPNFFNEAVFQEVIWKDPRN